MRKSSQAILAGCLLATAACGGLDPESPEENEPDAPLTMLLPSGAPSFTVIADAADGLDVPRDLDFNPDHQGELWIVNRGDESVTIVFDAPGAARSEHRKDGYALHFMADVSSIAFGDRTFQKERTFATCQESENTYDGQTRPDFFMGPALWTSKLDIFAVANPIGLGSHLDMLHESPDCMGIAHVQQNVYWVFDGFHGLLARYDFRKDHGPGKDDHSDGVIEFLAEPTVMRVPDVPSHLDYDKVAKLLYVADTGNARVLRVNAEPATEVAQFQGTEQGVIVRGLDGAEVTELVPASAELLRAPSGIALHAGTLYVGDNATGQVLAFDLEGTLLATMETGLPEGALMGIVVGPDERLYFTDAAGDRVLRVDL